MIIYAIIGLIVGLIICYLIMRPKHKLDQETLQKNENLKQEYGKLSAAVASAETEISALKNTKNDLNADIKKISEQAQATADEIYKKSYDLMQEKMSQSAEIAGYRYQLAQEQAQQEYLELLEENAKNYKEKTDAYLQEITQYSDKLAELKELASAAIEVSKRNLLEENKKKYYEIDISDDDKEDIGILKEVVKKLKKDPEPVNKLIWELYYKKPTMDLLGRIAPTGKTHCGIYKITNLQTNQCYIGQSVDLRNRLRDHIKAGLGISSSNNRFYTEMKALGPEAFMYEIIEECEKEQLNERERFWIKFYKSMDWGFNTLPGVKNDK